MNKAPNISKLKMALDAKDDEALQALLPKMATPRERHFASIAYVRAGTETEGPDARRTAIEWLLARDLPLSKAMRSLVERQPG